MVTLRVVGVILMAEQGGDIMKRLLVIFTVLLATVGLSATETYFPAEEYERYMNTIKEINPLAYDRLKLCEIKNSRRPCLRKGTKNHFEKGTEEMDQYPFLFLSPLLLRYPGEFLDVLPKLLNLYTRGRVDEAQPVDLEKGPFFHKYEYDHYMNLIKQIDNTTYEKLKQCEFLNGKPCLKRSFFESPIIIAGNEQSNGYPLLTFSSMLDISKNVKKEILSKWVNIYNEVPLVDYYFSPEDYNRFMDTIKSIDSEIYKSLKDCEIANSKPCLKKEFNSIVATVENPTQENHWYPTMSVHPEILTHCHGYNKKLLQINFEHYKSKQLTFRGERNAVLEVIRSLAPELYDLIITVDPTGENHIKRHANKDGASVAASPIDGLPVIKIGTNWIHRSDDAWTIGHELGHYVLGHCGLITKTEPFCETLSKKINSETSGYQGKKVDHKKKETNPLINFQETFKNTYSRNQEYEADRFALVDFGINLDNAVVAALNEDVFEENETFNDENPRNKATFRKMHPLMDDRIKHMQSLSREIELHENLYGIGNPTPIDWARLAQEYRDRLNPRR